MENIHYLLRIEDCSNIPEGNWYKVLGTENFWVLDCVSSQEEVSKSIFKNIIDSMVFLEKNSKLFVYLNLNGTELTGPIELESKLLKLFGEKDISLQIWK
jgi:hypothetical protein